MTTIYKYPLLPGRTYLEMPRGAQVLTVQMQRGSPYLWARVDPTEQKSMRVFEVFGTGHEMPDDPQLVYVATFQMDGGALVWHVFDCTHAA